jgi:hypothetical protein
MFGYIRKPDLLGGADIHVVLTAKEIEQLPSQTITSYIEDSRSDKQYEFSIGVDHKCDPKVSGTNQKLFEIPQEHKYVIFIQPFYHKQLKETGWIGGRDGDYKFDIYSEEELKNCPEIMKNFAKIKKIKIMKAEIKTKLEKQKVEKMLSYLEEHSEELALKYLKD